MRRYLEERQTERGKGSRSERIGREEGREI